MPPKGVALLGATGSIGRQTLDVIAAHPDRLRLVAVAAGSRAVDCASVADRFGAEAVALADPVAARRAGELLGAGRTEVLSGPAGVAAVACWPGADIVVAAISGVECLVPTLRAVGSGRRVALANKEALVVGGDLILAAAAASGAELLPVDSEHAAVWQVLDGREPRSVRRVVLTASGGPFRGLRAEEMDRAGPEAALRHPTWSMGPRITVDSATLMNKGFEVIEAHHLFGLPVARERIGVVVHPQSIVHALVEFADGTLLAQLSRPDMRLPIQRALSYPERWDGGGLAGSGLDLAHVGRLDFEEPDWSGFPCLELAYAAGAAGGTAPAVLNAADEVAVARFLRGELAFSDVPRLIEEVLAAHDPVTPSDVEAVLGADRWARRRAGAWQPAHRRRRPPRNGAAAAPK